MAQAPEPGTDAPHDPQITGLCSQERWEESGREGEREDSPEIINTGSVNKEEPRQEREKEREARTIGLSGRALFFQNLALPQTSAMTLDVSLSLRRLSFPIPKEEIILFNQSLV